MPQELPWLSRWTIVPLLLGLAAEGGGEDQRPVTSNGGGDVAGGPAAGVGEHLPHVGVGIEEHPLVHPRREVHDPALAVLGGDDRRVPVRALSGGSAEV